MVFLLLSIARAEVDARCDALVQPADYDEQVQTDFLNNYPALSTTLSPVHGPIPHKAGHGAVGVDLLLIPPLGCGQRMVLDWTKTEDTNKVPLAPRPRATFAFQPLLGRIFPYGGVAFVPPVSVGGTRSTVASAELGFGLYLSEHLQLGARAHGTLQRTLGDIATAYEEEDPAYNDLYVASSTGAELMAGLELERWTPYAALGFVETSSYFWIGDDGVVTNNLNPYLGPALSLGLDGLLWERLRVGGELYSAPGTPSSRDYGHILTGRLRLALEL